MKELRKSGTNTVLAGVCGGIAEYLGCDPTIIRLLFIALSIFVGSGLLVYILAAIIMPRADHYTYDA
ncbi:MAG: PspC domain-containing protein [Eubacterium sp.]|nr:PspC domain-containing protein [Eubacterium sp.]